MLEPGTPEWDESVRVSRGFVERADESVSDRNWRLGDEALEVAPNGVDSAKTGAWEKLQLYADQVGVKLSLIKNCRKVSAAWPASCRQPATSWTVHYTLMGYPELIVVGMTDKLARESVREQRRPSRRVVLDPDEVMGDSCMNTDAIVRAWVVEFRERAVSTGLSAREKEMLRELLEATSGDRTAA